MQNRFITSLMLIKQSMAIIRQRLSLLIFPCVSTILILVCIALISMPLVEKETIALKTNYISGMNYFIFLAAVLFLFALINMISLLFNAALTTCALKHMKHESYTVMDGFKAAFARLGKLFLWKIFMDTAGIIIRFLEYWMDSWPTFYIAKHILQNVKLRIAIFFVTPILMTEKLSLLSTVKRSAYLIKNNWGASQQYNVNIGIILFALNIISLLPALVAFLMGGKIIIIIGSTISTILLLSMSIIHSASHDILGAGLYLYANGVEMSEFYDTQLLRNAFEVVKKVHDN